MFRFHHLLTGCALATWAGAAAAQYPYPPQPYPQTAYPTQFAPPSDADQLAQELRSLTVDPANLYALINAARLSLKLGDTDGAAALYTRAEKVAPNNGQVKAGMGRLLVAAQRPGEALRLFREAAQLGASERDFGPDRALAYDLIGEQERAQREYRALLRQGPDDETTRRYALSLGISGLKEPALALLEPLNRRSDRGAWRARAFVLAMNADRVGAERIATTMMPPGMADGLRPFFDRLPTLPAIDRAFAVHFGEVRGNAARTADARRAPPLPALSPEANPFQAARAALQLAAAEPDPKKKNKRDKADKRAAARLAAAQPYVAPLPAPPAPTALQLAALGSTRLPPPTEAYGLAASPARGVTVLPPPADAYRPRETQLAANLPPVRIAPLTVPGTATDDGGDDEPEAPAIPAATRLTALPPATTTVASLTPPPVPPAQGSVVPTIAPSIPAATLGSAAIASFAQPPAPVVQAALPPTLAPVVPAPAASTPTVLATAPAATPALGAPPSPRGEGGDAVLAAILAGIKVPESELTETAAVTPVVTLGPAPLGKAKLLTTVEQKADAKARLDDAKVPKLPPKDARGRFVDARGKPLLDPRGRPLDAKAAAAWALAQADLKADPKLPSKDARGRFVDAKGKPLLDPRGRPLDAKGAAAWALARAESKADPKLPPKDARGRFVDAKGKPLLDPRGRPLDAKAAAAWKLADAKKKPEPAKAEPERIWVQVAGGANEDSLAKEWKRATGQAAALKGRPGWTTPLRATNRVLTGPFKTVAEAMALVNQLKKQGVAAFMFTSDPGQKVSRLGAN